MDNQKQSDIGHISAIANNLYVTFSMMSEGYQVADRDFEAALLDVDYAIDELQCFLNRYKTKGYEDMRAYLDFLADRLNKAANYINERYKVGDKIDIFDLARSEFIRDPYVAVDVLEELRKLGYVKVVSDEENYPLIFYVLVKEIPDDLKYTDLEEFI